MEEIKYAIYPSLLDAYLRFKRNDDDETFDSLFDKINKVKTEQTEQQLKGVEFENCVNARIAGDTLVLMGGEYKTDNFSFKSNLIDHIAGRLQYASKQQEYMEAIIPSHLGNIKLYGIADYTFPEMITDLKSTASYKCNKYKDNSQHPVYSLIKKINGDPIKAFKYLASDFNNMFLETYVPTDKMYGKLMLTIFDFINFIEYFKANITDGKIFGKESGFIHAADLHQEM
jgi:hypothetical protein